MKKNKKSIKFRLISLVGILIFSMACLGYFGLSGITKLTQKAHEINQNYLTKVTNLFKLTEHLYSVVIEGKNHIVSSETFTKMQADERIEKNIKKVDIYMKEIEKTLKTDKDIELFEQFKKEYKLYKDINKKIKAFSSVGLDREAANISANEELYVFRNLQQILQKMMAINIEKANINNQEAYILEKKTSLEIYIVIVFIVIFSFSLSYSLIKDITKSISSLKNNLIILGNGDIPDRILEENSDEIGSMAKVSNFLSENTRKIVNFAKAINKGDFELNFKSLGKQDVLGNILIDLRDNLKSAKKERIYRKEEDKKRHWASEGLTFFSEILRNKNKNLEELSSNIIINLVKYLKANQGGFFIYKEENNEKFLELIAAFAYGRKKLKSKKIKIGEGLLGVCAIEKNIISLKEIPENYINITSGMGDAPPNHLLIIPIVIDEQIIAIIEIASFKEFEDFEIKFIEKITESIATTIANTKINLQTIEFLKQSKKQEKIFKDREESLKRNLQNLKKEEKKISQRQIERIGVLKSINKNLIRAEFSMDAVLINANFNFLETMNYDNLANIRFKHFKEIFSYKEIAFSTKMWKNICDGEVYKKTIKKKIDDKIVKLHLNFYAVLDEKNKTAKILNLSFII